MISNYRKLFNAQFRKKYQELKMISHPTLIITHFSRNLPFISEDLKEQLIEGCNDVIAFIKKRV
jgi:hypothetical protein